MMHHRRNEGFEALAVNSLGTKAWVALQSAIDESSEFKKSRVIRVLELDVSNPLNILYSGMFVFLTPSKSEFPTKADADDFKYSAASFVSDQKIMFTERAKGDAMQLLVVDFAGATNVKDMFDGDDGDVLDHPDTDLRRLKVVPGSRSIVFRTTELSTNEQLFFPSKLEGLLVISSTLVATMIGEEGIFAHFFISQLSMSQYCTRRFVIYGEACHDCFFF
jgi:hypothetical protein